MDDTLLESHIAAALGRNRTPFDRRGGGKQIAPQNNRSAWAADYGPGRKAAVLDAARLGADSGQRNYGAGGRDGKSGVDNGHWWSGKALWRKMMSCLCPGTRNVILAVGALVFIWLV